MALEDDPGDLVVHPDLTVGLQAYANRAHALARQLAARGPVHVTATFSRPLGSEDVIAIASMGAEVTTIEAVSRLDADGLRMTVGDAYGPGSLAFFDEVANAEGMSLLGVTSATLTIPDMVTLNRLMRDERVWLLDASREQVRRSARSVGDVHLDDLYWQRAGWAPIR